MNAPLAQQQALMAHAFGCVTPEDDDIETCVDSAATALAAVQRLLGEFDTNPPRSLDEQDERTDHVNSLLADARAALRGLSL